MWHCFVYLTVTALPPPKVHHNHINRNSIRIQHRDGLTSTSRITAFWTPLREGILLFSRHKKRNGKSGSSEKIQSELQSIYHRHFSIGKNRAHWSVAGVTCGGVSTGRIQFKVLTTLPITISSFLLDLRDSRAKIKILKQQIRRH